RRRDAHRERRRGHRARRAAHRRHPRRPARSARRLPGRGFRIRRPAHPQSRRRVPRRHGRTGHGRPRIRPRAAARHPAGMTPMTTLTAPAAIAGFASGGLVAPPRRLAVFTTFVGRSVLHTLRTPDALVMAIALPTMLMLLFTQVFGGAIDPAGGYVDYVVPD